MRFAQAGPVSMAGAKMVTFLRFDSPSMQNFRVEEHVSSHGIFGIRNNIPGPRGITLFRCGGVIIPEIAVTLEPISRVVYRLKGTPG